MEKKEIKYVTPMAKVIEIYSQAIICQSSQGNESAEEVNYGDGGFSQQ